MGAPAAEMSRTLEQGRAEDERWQLCKNGTRVWASAVMAPLPATTDGRPRGFVEVICDRTEARRERREVLLRELDHRVKNALAVVQSVALQSGRHAPTPADFHDGLPGYGYSCSYTTSCGRAPGRAPRWT